MFMYLKQIRRVVFCFLTTALVLIFVACDDSGDDDGVGTMSSVSIKADYNTVLSKSAAGDTLSIDTAKILIKNIEFQSALDDDSLDFKTGPFVVVLDLTGQVSTVTTGTIPPGTYDRIKFKIHKPEDTEVIPDPEFRIGTSGDERFSVIVKGVFNGVPFLFRSKEGLDQELPITPPLTIAADGKGINTTLLADVSSWFVDSADGSVLDPMDAENEDLIDENIENSFEAFEDDDKDGNDDSN